MGAGRGSRSTALPLPFSCLLTSFASLFFCLANFLSFLALFLSISASASEVGRGAAAEEEEARVEVEGTESLVRFLEGTRAEGVGKMVEVDAMGCEGSVEAGVFRFLEATWSKRGGGREGGGRRKVSFGFREVK